MQTDILFKRLNSSLEDLKNVIKLFENHTPPSTESVEELYLAITHSYKLTSAYAILKEQKDISPDLDMHLKLMAVPTVETISEMSNPKVEKKISELKSSEEIVPEIVIPIETITKSVPSDASIKKEIPKITVNINDKFRFINELFKANSNEYNIAIEQINAVVNLEDALLYLKGLKSIYGWDEENEMVKKLFSLTQKRFI